MTTFLDLSDDKIIEICETLDDKSLWQFTQSNKRISNLCGFIFNERKSEYIDELIDDFSDALQGVWYPETYTGLYPSSSVVIREIKGGVIVEQYALRNIPKFLSEMGEFQDLDLYPDPTFPPRRLIILRKDLPTLLHLNDVLVTKDYVKAESSSTLAIISPKLYRKIPRIYYD